MKFEIANIYIRKHYTNSSFISNGFKNWIGFFSIYLDASVLLPASLQVQQYFHKFCISEKNI